MACILLKRSVSVHIFCVKALNTDIKSTQHIKVCPGSNYENSAPMVVKDAAADDNDGDVVEQDWLHLFTITREDDERSTTHKIAGCLRKYDCSWALLANVFISQLCA